MTEDLSHSSVTLEEALGPGSPIVVFDNVHLAFDEKVILRGVSFTLIKGQTKIILGASGAGKSTILKLIVGLLKPDAGIIWVNGERTDQMSEKELMRVRRDLGLVFQEGALFDSLTVRENVGYKLFEEGTLPVDQIDRRVEEVLGFVGLKDQIDKRPSALSGGQRRRVAIARAMTSKPKILLYDEPTTGLDPITAMTVDAEIVKLRDLEGVSSILVTHQLRDAFYVAEQTAVRSGTQNPQIEFEPAAPEKIAQCEFMMLREGVVIFEGDANAFRHAPDPYIQNFLS